MSAEVLRRLLTAVDKAHGVSMPGLLADLQHSLLHSYSLLSFLSSCWTQHWVAILNQSIAVLSQSVSILNASMHSMLAESGQQQWHSHLLHAA